MSRSRWAAPRCPRLPLPTCRRRHRALLPQPTPTAMDFKGQKLSETVCVWIVTVAAVLAFLYGYARQDFQVGKGRNGGQRAGCCREHAAGMPATVGSCRALTAATFHTPTCDRLSSSALPPSDDACWSHPAGRHLPLPSLAASCSPHSRQAMMLVFGGGCTAAFVATVPDWPVYNKNPITWLPPKGEPARRGGSGGGARSTGSKGGSKKKGSSSWASLFGF